MRGSASLLLLLLVLLLLFDPTAFFPSAAKLLAFSEIISFQHLKTALMKNLITPVACIIKR